MKLRGTEFGPCLDAAGLRGFWHDGWWFHHLPVIGTYWYDFTGSTFVAKTTTTNERPGNMPSNDEWQPASLFPKCIWVDLVRGIALNAVGLGGPGARVVLSHGLGLGDEVSKPQWPESDAYMISWAPEGATPEARLKEFAEFVFSLAQAIKLKPWLRRLLGLQINLSCPNSGVKWSDLTDEAAALLHVAEVLDIPILVKVNLLVPARALLAIAEHPACDGLCISNTVPFGELPNRIPWEVWFPHGSPLAKFGGGGLSGWPLLPLVEERIRELRALGMKKPINAGGGILGPGDVDRLVGAGLRPGVDSVFIGSIAMLRPWRIRSTIRRAHELLTK